MAYTRSLRKLLVIALVCAVALGIGYQDMRLAGNEQSLGGIDLHLVLQIQFLAFTANGFVLLAFMGLLGFWPREALAPTRATVSRLLMAWALIGAAFNLFLVPPISFGAVRHLISYLLPLTLLAAPQVESWAGQARFPRLLTRASVVASASLAFLLAQSDLMLARVYPRVCEQFISIVSARRTVWFVGDPSFRYYAETAGGKYWDRNLENASALPQTGDLLVVPVLQGMGVAGRTILARCRAFDRQQFNLTNPVRTVSQLANYYGATSATLPWELALHLQLLPNEPPHFTGQLLEEVLIYEIK